MFLVLFSKIRKKYFSAKIAKKPQIQSCITQKRLKMNLSDSILKNTGYLFLRNPSRTQIVTFSVGQKVFDYLGNCDYSGCDYYESGH